MNIAIFASAFSPSLGGVEELCRQLALELMRQGHGVIVLTNRWPRDLPATASIDGISVYRLPFRLPEGSAKAAINYHLTHRRVERDMLAILRSHHIDMLHVQCVSSNAHYAMIAQEKLGLPLVVTLQGELTMDANQIFQKSPQAQEILRRALDQAQVITGCSGKTLRDGEDFYGKPFGDRGRVIFNGVNLADFGSSMSNATGVGDPSRRARDKLPTQISQINDGKKLEDRSSKLGDNASRQVYPAGQNESEAHPQPSASCPLPSDFSPSGALRYSNSYLLTPRYSPEGGSYIFALGRMAKQKGFDVLIQAYAAAAAAARLRVTGDRLQGGDPESGIQNPESGIQSPEDAKCQMLNTKGSPSAALPNHSRFEVLDSDSFPALILAGDGPELENLKSLVRDLRLADRVHFPGRADRRQVASYMVGCEFFVISSPAEPFGIVILEAMAAGAPVIAINNAGPAEIITDGVNGLLVERSEPALLAAAMQRLMGDSALRDRLSIAGRERATEFSWPTIANRYLAVYAAETATKS